jgi:hypothetical protein
MNPINFGPISFPSFGIEVNPGRSISLGPLTVHYYGLVIALGLVLAVVYGLKKKEWSVKGIRNIALIAGTLAVLPNLIRSDVMVVPNVFGAITLFADALVAHILVKDLAKGEKTDSPRKTRHL